MYGHSFHYKCFYDTVDGVPEGNNVDMETVGRQTDGVHLLKITTMALKLFHTNN